MPTALVHVLRALLAAYIVAGLLMIAAGALRGASHFSDVSITIGLLLIVSGVVFNGILWAFTQPSRSRWLCGDDDSDATGIPNPEVR